MRKLSTKQEDEIIEIADTLGDCVHEFYARHPTTTERFQYDANKLERKGNTIYNRLPQQRQHYGKKVLTGFKKGTLGDEEGNSFSSDPSDPDYREDWKELISAGYPEAFDVMAKVMFESSRTLPRSRDDSNEDLELKIVGDEGEEQAAGPEDNAGTQQNDGSEDGTVAEELEDPLAKSSSGKSKPKDAPQE